MSVTFSKTEACVVFESAFAASQAPIVFRRSGPRLAAKLCPRREPRVRAKPRGALRAKASKDPPQTRSWSAPAPRGALSSARFHAGDRIRQETYHDPSKARQAEWIQRAHQSSVDCRGQKDSPGLGAGFTRDPRVPRKSIITSRSRSLLANPAAHSKTARRRINHVGHRRGSEFKPKSAIVGGCDIAASATRSMRSL